MANTGTILEIVEEHTANAKETWYEVRIGVDVVGFIRGDLLDVMEQDTP